MAFSFPSEQVLGTDASFTPINGGGSIEDGWYYITDSSGYILPPIGAEAQTVVLLAANEMMPTITSSNGESIVLDVDDSDTSIEFGSQSLLMLVSNVDHWDMVEVMVNGANEHTHTKDEVGLDQVDNTSDLDKPISNAMQTALDLKADASSLSEVDNTSDVDKPVSTATMEAINAASTSSVNTLSVSGVAVSGGQINQIVDSGSFTAPAASSVPDRTILVIELPVVHATETPSLTSFAGDVFENDEGSDTSITWEGAARLTLTSDGINTWSL